MLRKAVKKHIDEFLKPNRHAVRNQISLFQYQVDATQDDTNLIEVIWEAIKYNKLSDRIFKIKLLEILCVHFKIEKETKAKIQNEIGEKTKYIMGPSAFTVVHNCHFKVRYEAINEQLQLTQKPRQYALN